MSSLPTKEKKKKNLKRAVRPRAIVADSTGPFGPPASIKIRKNVVGRQLRKKAEKKTRYQGERLDRERARKKLSEDQLERRGGGVGEGTRDDQP